MINELFHPFFDWMKERITNLFKIHKIWGVRIQFVRKQQDLMNIKKLMEKGWKFSSAIITIVPTYTYTYSIHILRCYV